MLSEGAASQPVTLAGEQLIARADGSLFWPSESALFVADLHFGKAATFRSAAVAVPVGTSASMFRRLIATLNETGARRLYFLGDLWHAKEGRKSEILQSFEDWRRAYKGVEMVLVEGNHDRRSGKLPTWLSNCVTARRG